MANGTELETRRPAFDLRTVALGSEVVAVQEQVVVRRPFADLRRFTLAVAMKPRPQVLLVAPLSGQFAALLRDMVAGLVAAHDVYVTDWIDAREVSAAQGPFGFDDNIAYILDFLRHIGRRAHIIALCQATVPALAATALLAAGQDRLEPRSLILVAGPVDARINPSRVARFAAQHSLAWFERTLIRDVPEPYPGHRRRIYPSSAQLGGLMLYLARHMTQGGELYDKVLRDDGLGGQQHAFLPLFLSVMDLAAEVYLDTLRVLFQECALARGTLTWRGAPVELRAIRRTALMTVEGARDDVAGPGQTHAAHALCPAIPHRRRWTLAHPAAGHFSTFHGQIWRTAVLPAVADFIRRAAR